MGIIITPMTTKLPVDIATQVCIYAAAREMKPSQVIRLAVKRFLDQFQSDHHNPNVHQSKSKRNL